MRLFVRSKEEKILRILNNKNLQSKKNGLDLNESSQKITSFYRNFNTMEKGKNTISSITKTIASPISAISTIISSITIEEADEAAAEEA